jgi:hypothetical protein
MPKLFLPKPPPGAKFRRKPKWGWGCPSFDPPKQSAAFDRHQVPRAFHRDAFWTYSNSKLSRKSQRYFTREGGKVGRFLRRLGRLFSRKRQRARRPPRIRAYRTNIGD